MTFINKKWKMIGVVDLQGLLQEEQEEKGVPDRGSSPFRECHRSGQGVVTTVRKRTWTRRSAQLTADRLLSTIT